MKMLLKDGKTKVLTFSYDDGRCADTRLVEIFNRYGLKATFNISSGLYAEDDSPENKYLTLSQAQALYKSGGHEIAVHGYMHLHPARISSVALIQEILNDRKAIESDYGVITRGAAYAYGNYNQNVMDILKQCGIVYARTTHGTYRFILPDNWLALNPTCHHRDARLMELADRFVNTTPKHVFAEMFYVWGHSYEFDNDNNWDVMEKFAAYVSGHEHIWYATNIEIYDYVSAYNQLQVSVDESIITNPTAIDVWVEVDKEPYCVKAGETLILK